MQYVIIFWLQPSSHPEEIMCVGGAEVYCRMLCAQTAAGGKRCVVNGHLNLLLHKIVTNGETAFPIKEPMGRSFCRVSAAADPHRDQNTGCERGETKGSCRRFDPVKYLHPPPLPPQRHRCVGGVSGWGFRPAFNLKIWDREGFLQSVLQVNDISYPRLQAASLKNQPGEPLAFIITV